MHSMREIIRLVEGVGSNVIYKNEDGLVVIENPSKDQFFGLMNRSQGKQLRGLLGGTLIVWDAYLATHAEVIRTLAAEIDEHYDGADLEFEPDKIVMNSFWPDAPMDSKKAATKARQTAKWLRKELSRYYAPNTPVTLVLDGSYESITV